MLSTLDADVTPRLTLAQFESHLCGATDILRGRIDSADYKHGIDDASHARGDTLPPGSYGDLAFVQHMIASLSTNGMLGVVLPHGILLRGGAEGRIRQGMLLDDVVEAVIGLAPNLFYGTGIPACILIVNRDKPAARLGRVLFVHGSEECVTGKNQNTLSDENLTRLSEAFHNFRDEERVSRVVPLEEIADIFGCAGRLCRQQRCYYAGKTTPGLRSSRYPQ